MTRKEQKSLKEYLCGKLVELHSLQELIKSAGEDGKRTITQKEFFYFLNEYLGLYQSITALTTSSTALSEYASDNYSSLNFYTLSEKIHNELVYHLFRILYPKDNIHVRAESTEKITETIIACEDLFTEDVETAINFFKDNYEIDFRSVNTKSYFPNSTKVSCMLLPSTIQKMLDDSSRFDWLQHKIIVGGYPVPCFLDFYRIVLKNYINEFIKKLEVSSTTKPQEQQ